MEALATITSVKGLVLALQAIKTTHKLPCAVKFDASGLTLRFLDGGHAMQSGIYLSRAVFSHYQAPTTSSLTFFVPLSVLLDSVATVASSMPQELHLQYPGPANSFLITATEDTSGRTFICSYAKIATLAQQELSSLEDVWDPADASSHAILSGLLLREAIEDLEWTGGAVEFVLKRSPSRFALRSVKQQSLEISFPHHVLDSFSCHEDEVCASYKHKHLKAAFTHVAQKDPWSAKVSISSRGVLKVTHMLTLAGGATAVLEAQHPLGTLTSQGSAQRMCVVQFLIMPFDEGQEEQEAAGGGALGPDEDP